MNQRNSIFIATSLDGYIADREGNIDWLESVPNPEGLDMGYADFMERVDALVMGRKTFETVLGFDVDWPYACPVYVLSNSLGAIPPSHHDKVSLLRGPLKDVLSDIHGQGHHRLYIDGGACIQSFLREDLIDEMVITVFPILLGGGARLFGKTEASLDFELIDVKPLLGQLVQQHYRRKR